jgi:hypothetical protein
LAQPAANAQLANRKAKIAPVYTMSISISMTACFDDGQLSGDNLKIL